MTTVERPTTRYVEHVMGLPISLALRGRHTREGAAHAAWTEVIAELREVDLMFSTYRVDSVISRLNRAEITEDDCPPQIAQVLALGVAAHQQSFGAFNVRRPGPDGRPILDPSGVVKGWVVERAAAALRRLDDTDFCLSAGGDMTCRTVDLTDPPWRIGIENPHDANRILAVVPVFNGAVATSGTIHRGAHLVDARTGSAPTAVASVTVITRSLTLADIDATAAYAQGPAAARWLTNRPGRTGLIVWTDGTTTTPSTLRQGRRN